MDKRTAVIYSSKYGTTKQYARWIAEELDCSIYSINSINDIDFKGLQTIIFGSGLYAGDINHKKILEKHKDKNLIVFTVGLSEPSTTDYKEILDRNFISDLQKKIQFFHLRGGINYRKLSYLDRFLMLLLKKSKLDRKPEVEKTSDEILMQETYGTKVSFIDKDTIKPIISCVKNL